MKKRIGIYGTIIFVTIVCIFLFTSGIGAQEKYPNRPIEHIVPFPAGGQADMTARICSKYLEKILGVAVPVVKNLEEGRSLVILIQPIPVLTDTQ